MKYLNVSVKAISIFLTSVFLLAFSFILPANSQNSNIYEYDDLGRISKVQYIDVPTASGRLIEYEYDDAGNRLTKSTSDFIIPLFSIDNVAVTENGDAILTVTKTGVTTFSSTVEFITADNTAIAGSDYLTSSGTLNFAAADVSKTITISTINDSLFELTEDLFVNLTLPTNALIADGQGVVTINDNDTAPSFTIDNVAASEGGNAVFTVTKTGSTSLSSSVNFATANSAAVAGTDYTTSSGTLNFAVGDVSKTITVSTINDSAFETAEGFYINLTSPTNATISDAQGIGTINDNDPTPYFTINNVIAAEGSNVTFTITKTGVTSYTHNVNYATAVGSAGSSDFTAKSGTLSFAAGTTSLTVSVVTAGDTVYENDETFYLNLSAATNGATISDNQGVGTIDNNDAAPSFTVNHPSVTEGSGLVITVTKNGLSAFTHTVNYATSNNSATAGSDYVAKSGTLSFAPGVSSKTVTISTINNELHENSESFFFSLSSPSNNATIGNIGSGTIIDDDPIPSFSVNNVTTAEGTNANFIITRAGATGTSHVVNFFTEEGSAGYYDYTGILGGSVTFGVGEVTKTVPVSVTSDSLFENAEQFFLILISVNNGATISDNTGVGTISNDDGPPSFSINNRTVSEGNNATFTITKSGSTAFTHNVNYATATGSAGSSDFTAKSGTLSFSAGTSTLTVSVPTATDTVNEGNETFYMNLSSPTSGASILDSQGVGTITNVSSNGIPIANNDFVSSDKPVYVYVLNNDSDPDGDTLTITAASVSSGSGTVTRACSNTCLSMYSTSNFTASYTISDGNGGTDTAQVTYTYGGGGGGPGL